MPIMITEMGYSTNPPNPFRGASLTTQAAWINESDYLAYKQPRVYSMTQFEFRDSPPVRTAKPGTRSYWATFQTGITFANGTPKPSYIAYMLPFWIHSGSDSRGARQLELWAQVRFRKGSPSGDTVVFQFQPKGSGSWNAVTQPFGLANAYGFVDAIVPAGPYSGGGTFRAVWSGPVPPDTFTSRSVPYP